MRSLFISRLPARDKVIGMCCCCLCLNKYSCIVAFQGEGVAYRGRILVELSTFLEKTPPDKKLELISNDDLLIVEVNTGM